MDYVVKHILKNELLTQKNRLKRRFFLYRWSEWRDLNPRHPAPKAGALPTALHPVIQFLIRLGGFSQSRRATNCATPGYCVVLSGGVDTPKLLGQKGYSENGQGKILNFS